VHTLLKAFKRKTDATEKMLNSVLLGFTTIAMNVFMWKQLRPAFEAVGRSDDLSVPLAISAAATIGVAVALFFKLPSEWHKIVADQARNDAAGCNIVGQREKRLAAHYDAATAKAKELKRNSAVEQAMAG
jgi:TRAP-type C4-dicarboxylate transport system permease small subunit